MALAGCAGPLSTLEPAGPAARSIATLWWAMLLGATAIFGLVMALLSLAWRRRAPAVADGDGEGFWILGLGLAFPVAVLAVLLGYGLWIGERLIPRKDADATRVSAQAAQWTWTFAYDDAPGLTTLDVLHIPSGRPVDVAITTTDVIHSFWVPRLAGKLDTIPGHVNVLRIEADVPGAYAGVSSEFSGPGFDRHGFTVVAHTQEDWQAFLAGSQ